MLFLAHYKVVKKDGMIGEYSERRQLHESRNYVCNLLFEHIINAVNALKQIGGLFGVRICVRAQRHNNIRYRIFCRS